MAEMSLTMVMVNGLAGNRPGEQAVPIVVPPAYRVTDHARFGGEVTTLPN